MWELNKTVYLKGQLSATACIQQEVAIKEDRKKQIL